MDANLLTTWLEAARTAARRGAAQLLEWRDKAGGFQVRSKGRHDFVTDADEASQQAVKSYLAERFPAHGFLGEEDIASQKKPGPGAPPTWIVDPLDGTTNYVHDLPLYCVSIGLQVEGAMVVGVVYDPVRDEMFSAAHRMGAWANDRRLATSHADKLEDALLATGFPPDMNGQERMLEWWQFFSFRAQSLRRTGSTALNLAYLAAGRFDGYWAFDNKVWDVAGGMVLVREAGGIITNLAGESFDPFHPYTLASNGPLHPAFLECFQHGTDRPAPPR